MRFLFSLLLSSIFVALPFSAIAAGKTSPPPTCTLSASPTTIQSGSPSKLSWKTTNALYISIDGKNTSTPGSETISPKKTTTYRGVASGPGGAIACQTTVKVTTTSTSALTTTSKVSSSNSGICRSGKGGLCNPLKANSIEGLLVDILSYLVKIGTIFIILMLVFVGFKFVAARGNSGELEKARNMLLWTIIGAIIILGAQAIAMGIASTISAISQVP